MLSAMKMSELRQRALDGGCTFEELENAEDMDDSKRALAELIIAQMHSQSHGQVVPGTAQDASTRSQTAHKLQAGRGSDTGPGEPQHVS
eukprot:COSAG02_NODE_62616_length_265_cov_0.921687_1_plen_88_part_11